MPRRLCRRRKTSQVAIPLTSSCLEGVFGVAVVGVKRAGKRRCQGPRKRTLSYKRQLAGGGIVFRDIVFQGMYVALWASRP